MALPGWRQGHPRRGPAGRRQLHSLSLGVRAASTMVSLGKGGSPDSPPRPLKPEGNTPGGPQGLVGRSGSEGRKLRGGGRWSLLASPVVPLGLCRPPSPLVLGEECPVAGAGVWYLWYLWPALCLQGKGLPLSLSGRRADLGACLCHAGCWLFSPGPRASRPWDPGSYCFPNPPHHCDFAGDGGAWTGGLGHT